jgi:hypothetical protein
VGKVAERVAEAVKSAVKAEEVAVEPEPEVVIEVEPEPEPEPEPEEEVVVGPPIGSFVTLSNRNWRVLDVQDGKMLLVSEKVLEQQAYHDKNEGITWETCTLRAYLNKNFYNSLSAEAKGSICEMKLTNENNEDSGAHGGVDTTDKVFLLSISEAETYFSDDKDRIAYGSTGTASWWWLRSPGRTNQDDALVNGGGKHKVSSYVSNNVGGVRPAVWVRL